MDIEVFCRFAEQMNDVDCMSGDMVVHNAGSGLAGHAWQANRSQGRKFRDANTRVRQQLISALKETFGTTRLSYIPKAVLNQLNLSDFDLDANDNVKSDKPLTARRIKLVTDAVKNLKTLEQRTERFKEIVGQAMTKDCVKELVSLVKNGKLSSSQALTDFIARHFDGSVGERIREVMAVSRADCKALCGAVSRQLLAVLKPELAQAGITRAHLESVQQALATFQVPKHKRLWGFLAEAFAYNLKANAEAFAQKSFDMRLGMRLENLNAIQNQELTGTFEKNMKSEHGRDILLRTALDCFDNIDRLSSELRGMMDLLLPYLSNHVKELGSERTYILALKIQRLIGNDNTGVNRMQARQVLGNILKHYTDLTDSDLKQFSTLQLRDFVLAAADDSLVQDRKKLTEDGKRKAEAFKRLNYTDAETHEMMSFVQELNKAPGLQPQPPVEQPVQVPVANQKHAAALAKNKIVCDDLALLGKLFHREDVWTSDALGGAQAIFDTLTRNEALVQSLKTSWDKMGADSLSIFSKATVIALNKLINPNGWKVLMLTAQGMDGFTESLHRINVAVMEFAKARTQEARMAACNDIAGEVDTFTRGLGGHLQEMLTDNLDAVLGGADGGSTFKGLPPNASPETADLLALAKSRHPAPKYETKAQCTARQKAILDEYAKLVLDPQAGGFGALIRSLASNYVDKLDLREKRAMLSGALQSLTPEALTEMMKDNALLDLVSIIAKDGFDALGNLFPNIAALGQDGKLTEAQKKVAGDVAGGILKGAGPVLQKMVQMLGAEKLPKFLQKAVKDCKSNLKPIPQTYVTAKLNEIVRQSNGKIRSIVLTRSLGAASIAEAFECTLTDHNGNSRQVVVKMLRPDVRGRMEREIAAIRESVRDAGEGALRSLNARIESLLGELDFAEERQNIKDCHPIYGESSYSCLRSVKLVEDCPQLSDVLVMEKAPGQTFQKYMDATTERLNGLLDGKMGLDEKGHYQFTMMSPEEHAQLSRQLTDMYRDVQIRQANLQRLVQTWFSNAVFGNGKFHGDLHGGNIMVDDAGNATVIDFGNAPTFSGDDRKNVVNLVIGAMRGEPESVLDAAFMLLSSESKTQLTRVRASLTQKFEAMFAVGGIENAESRLKAVFGEMARAGIEVPAALYNFVEAFGRVQQLSNSMTTTLERISGALPYLRQHLPKVGDAPLMDNMSMRPEFARTMDEHIDVVLKERIQKIRREEPNISDVEIFKRLKQSSDQGDFNKLFDSYTEENPVVAHVLRLGSRCFTQGNLDRVLQTNPRFGINWEDFVLEDADCEKETAKAQYISGQYKNLAKENVEKFLAPYITLNPALSPLLDKLKEKLDVIYAPRNLKSGIVTLYPGGGIDYTLLNGEDPYGAGQMFDAEKFVQANLVDENSGYSEENIRTAARLWTGISCLFRDEILPEIVKVYKNRMRDVINGFDLSTLRPAVTMADSMASSVGWHLPKTIFLGGTNALKLVGRYYWNRLWDTTIDIRGNFDIKIDTFRSFAVGKPGRIRATKAKTLEHTASMNTLSVHNAEAWRALVESLCADLHMEEEMFYRTAPGRKIAALLEFSGKESVNDIEQAMPLTTEALQSVLAAYDLEKEKLDRAKLSCEAVGKFLNPTGSLADTTYEQFRTQLDTAFRDLFGRDAVMKLNINSTTIDRAFKGHYGKVIARMSAIGAADPHAVMTGGEPRPVDVRRWMVAAFLEEFGELVEDEESKNRVALETVFGEGLGRFRARLAELNLLAKSPILTAMLLHALDGKVESEQLFQFLKGLKEQVPRGGAGFRTTPSKDDFDTDAQSARQLVPAANPDSPNDSKSEELRQAMQKTVGLMGYGIWKVAANDDLYKRFIDAKKQLPQEPLPQEFLGEIKKAVRREIYVGNVQPPLDEDIQVTNVLTYWAAKAIYENLLKNAGSAVGLFNRLVSFFTGT